MKTFLFEIRHLNNIGVVGIENAINWRKIWTGWMESDAKRKRRCCPDNPEACDYLRISRPTYVKCLYTGRIKGTKAGKGWKVLKSELDRFLKGESG